MILGFRSYDKNNKLDMINKKLYKNSKGRFTLCKSKRGVFYLLDSDDKVVRNYNEIYDILECMHIDRKVLKEV